MSTEIRGKRDGVVGLSKEGLARCKVKVCRVVSYASLTSQSHRRTRSNVGFRQS